MVVTELVAVDTATILVSNERDGAVEFAFHPGADWENVRKAATTNVWQAEHGGSPVDRWIVLHDCQDPSALVRESRGGLEIAYVRLDPTGGLPLDLREIMREWLGGPASQTSLP